jgi:hypothetical protein
MHQMTGARAPNPAPIGVHRVAGHNRLWSVSRRPVREVLRAGDGMAKPGAGSVLPVTGRVL